MRRAFRLFLVCLLTLTLPLQGASAAVMALRMADAPMQSGSAYSMDCHGSHMQMQQDDQHAHEHGTPAKAKACSSCCSGAIASVSPLATLSEPLGRDNYLPLSPRAPTGYIPDGLERPPRAVS